MQGAGHPAAWGHIVAPKVGRAAGAFLLLEARLQQRTVLRDLRGVPTTPPRYNTIARVNCVPNTVSFQPSRYPSTGWHRRRRQWNCQPILGSVLG